MTARVPIRRILPRPFIPMTASDFELFDALTMPEPNTGCVLWLGNVNSKGYGTFWTGTTLGMAHRLAFQRASGPIPELMCVCHRCDTPACVNPDHFFAGTIDDNNKDMARKGRARGAPPDKRRRRSVCKRGHPMSGENLRIIAKPDGRRIHQCRACVELQRSIEHAAAEERKAARRAERLNAPRTCALGHLIAGDNVIDDGDGYRRCRACRRAYHQARYLAKTGKKGGLFPAINGPCSGDSAAFETRL